jgi:ribosomal protein S27AE
MDTGRIKGKFVILPRHCQQCGRTIHMERIYPIYLEWYTIGPWKHCVARKWEVCENCCHEYVMHIREKLQEKE